MFAQLGDVTFELLGSFASLEETHAAQFAQHDVLAGRALAGDGQRADRAAV